MEVGILGLIYHGIGSRTVEYGVLGSNILLVALICITGPWFFVVVAWRHNVWVVMIDVGILGLILVRVGRWRYGGHQAKNSH